MENTDKLQRWIDQSKNIVFFGGAGVSTESGIPDFRSDGGLYRKKFDYPPEYILSHTFFINHTEEFFDFYRRYMLYDHILPNAAHYKLAAMEEAGKLSAVITQNIDGLHQKAGSKKVFELHGSVYKNRCMSCGKFYGLNKIKESEGIPRCDCGGIIKPEVVLYEEPLPSDALIGAENALEKADLLIIAGTSLTVYPAAGLATSFKKKKVLIDLSSSPLKSEELLFIQAKVGETLSKITI